MVAAAEDYNFHASGCSISIQRYMGPPAINAYIAVISMSHLMMKFLVEDDKKRVIGVGVAR